MSFTLVAGIIMNGLVLLRTRDDASLLTSSIVLTYCLYLQWSALRSDTDIKCNPFYKSTSNTICLIICGLFFTFASLLVISSTKKKEEEHNVAVAVNSALLENSIDNGLVVADIKDRGVKNIAKEMHVFPITTATIHFQGLLVLSAIYFAMLLTNWGAPTYGSGSASFFTSKS